MPVTETRPELLTEADRPVVGGDFALAQLEDGRLIVGTGPFQHSCEPAEEGVSFYHNTFDLSDPRPWRIPESWDELGSVDELAASGRVSYPALEWEVPSKESFAEAFARVEEALSSGELVKAVPAVTACANFDGGGEGLAQALVSAARNPGSSAWLYGFREGGRGFVGLTPERLFTMDTERLETMALAGTAVPADGESFEKDAKEREEHDLVVQALRRRLATFGEVKEGGREILDVGGMIHFLTKFEVRLQVHPSIHDVIDALHPTPAVGAVPRNAESLKALLEMRKSLGVPTEFGAPFGVKYGERFEASVAIRGVFWRDGRVFVPAGCGIVAASQMESEWQELDLKRHWVMSAFGLE